MRVLMAAVGTRGDVQPMLALALRLSARGHAVVFAAPPDAEAWVRGMGLSHLPLGRDFRAFLGEVGTRVHTALPALRVEARRQFEVLADAAGEADLIVGAAVACAGLSLAEQRRIPYGYVAYSASMLPSRYHPAPLVRWQGLPGWANSASWWGVRGMLNLAGRRVLSDARRRLGLPPIRDVWRHLFSGTVLLAAEPSLSTPAADCREDVLQTGAWFLEEEGELPPALEAFLRAGPPPVYIGFGSMPSADPARTTRMILQAVKAASVRALVSEGWARLGAAELPPEVHLVGAVPHGKLFPRLSAVVHHGGAGTVAMAARAGLPQLLVPHLMDQFYWGQRVHDLGLGPPPIVQQHLSAARFGEALRILTSDEAMRRRATELARGMVTDGVDRAVRLIEEGRLRIPGGST